MTTAEVWLSRTGPPTAARALDVAEVFSALAPAVAGYLRASACQDPDDVLGEVFLRVARGLPRFEGTAAGLRSWVFTIAYRCLVDEHRRNRRQRLLVGRLRAPVAAPSPAEPLDADLVRALAGLTPEQREVVCLRFVADLSIDEVARITGRPCGAVKALQHRGLESLRARLAAG